jgi:cation transport ATPase
MYYVASVYSKLGGPLATVFKQATLNSVISSDIEILEIAEDGVSAMVDGKNIVLGRPAYMEAQCFGTSHDEGDEYYEGISNKRILYLACEQIVIAKFYIQYTMTSDFLSMVKRLADSGVAVSIRTADPCIDDGILYDNKMDSENQLVKVVRGILPEEKATSISAKAGGAVTVGSAKDLVKTFLLCNKIETVKKTNFVLKTVASILGIAVMVLLLFTGNAPMIRSIFPALYQLFWLMPIYCISKIYI